MATDRQTNRQTDRQTDRRHAKNNFFGLSGPQNVNIHQNLAVDFLGKCNTFSILRIAEKVKRDKYKDLRIELRRLWEKHVEIVPTIIGALGTIPKSLKRALEELGADVALGCCRRLWCWRQHI